MSALVGDRGPSLVISTAITTVLVLVFWLLAANEYTPSEVGVGATAIATMLVLADLAHLGLRAGLTRYLPIAGAGAPRLIIRSYGLAMGLAAGAAALFVVGLDVWAPGLGNLRSSFWAAALFVLATAFWVALGLGGSVLLGLRLPRWVPVASGVLGLLQVVLVPLLVGFDWELGVFAAWALPVFAVALVANSAVLRILSRQAVGPAEVATSEGGTKRAAAELPMIEVLSHSIADWLATSARAGIIGILPLVVLRVAGAEGSAFYLIAWVLAYAIYLMSADVGDTLLAGASADGDTPRRHTLHGTLLSMAISVPIVLIAIVVAPWVLDAFGSAYADESTALLRLLVVGAIPNIVVRAYVGRLRVERRMRAVIAYEVAHALSVLVAGWVLLAAMGIVGLGVAWLVMLSFAALYAVVIETLWWWAPRLGPRWVRWLASLVRGVRSLDRLRRSPALRREVRRTLGRMYTSRPSWSRIDLSADSQILSVAGHEGRPPLRVELARSPWGAELLVKRLEAISDLGKLTDISTLRALLPYPIEHHTEPGNQYLVESAISGRSGSELAGQLPVSQLVEAITGAVSQLHRATATAITFDDRCLEHWVEQPLERLSAVARTTDDDIDRLRTLLRGGLVGRQVPAARLHGNLTLDVTLFDQHGRLTGVLDWEWSEVGPVFIDWGSLALDALAVESRTDIGHVVSDAITEPDRFMSHPALVGPSLSGLDPLVAVLASWLHLLTPAVRAAATTPAGRFWMARNVRPVLDRLPGRVAPRA